LATAITLRELAQKVGGEILRGLPETRYTGMAALGAAGLDDISFLGNEKYRAQFLETRAGVVLVPHGEMGGDASVALVRVENPTLAFSEVVRQFAAQVDAFEPGVHPSASVHPSAVLDASKVCVHAGAVVSAGAQIGNGTEIGANVAIGEGVVIGQHCRLMANSTVRERCVLGDRVVLQPGAVVGSDGFGYEFSGGRHIKIEQVGIVLIGNDVEVGANTTIDRARFGKTVIGEGTKLDNLVQVGHNCEIGKHCLIVAQTGISGSTRIGDYVTIAGQAGVAGHLVIGDQSTIVGRAAVTTNLDGGGVYGGSPAILYREDVKVRAHARRLPKLVPKLLARVKALEEALKNLAS
jgi:UDP-3-O-[3-hydroxymyristoyl] glucosamine N-acyltransferase